MKIETIIVLIFTAITFAGLVWLEVNSRRRGRAAAAPSPENAPPVEPSSIRKTGG